MEIEITSHARTFWVAGIRVGRWCEENQTVTYEVIEGVNHVGEAVMRAKNEPDVTFVEVHEYLTNEAPEVQAFKRLD